MTEPSEFAQRASMHWCRRRGERECFRSHQSTLCHAQCTTPLRIRRIAIARNPRVDIARFGMHRYRAESSTPDSLEAVRLRNRPQRTEEFRPPSISRTPPTGQRGARSQWPCRSAGERDDGIGGSNHQQQKTPIQPDFQLFKRVAKARCPAFRGQSC